MPIGYWSLWGQPRSVTSGDLRWPWNSCDARSRVTASHVLTLITSTIPIQVNRTTPSCVYSRFRWNLAEGCSICDVITSWPDLTWPFFFHQKLLKGRPISYTKFQHDTPNGLACSSEKLMGGCINPPSTGEGLETFLVFSRKLGLWRHMKYPSLIVKISNSLALPNNMASLCKNTKAYSATME